MIAVVTTISNPTRGKMFAEVRLIQIRNGGEKYALEALEHDYTKLLWFENLVKPLKKIFSIGCFDGD